MGEHNSIFFKYEYRKILTEYEAPKGFVDFFSNNYLKILFIGVMASTPDSHAGGPGFKSRCRPTNFRPVWSPNPSPYPPKVKRMARASLKKEKLGPKDCGSGEPHGKQKKAL